MIRNLKKSNSLASKAERIEERLAKQKENADKKRMLAERKYVLPHPLYLVILVPYLCSLSFLPLLPSSS